MFETVAPETFQTRSRRLMVETLPLSLAVHALAIVAAVGAAVWNVAFPEASPRVSVAYSLSRIPDPPPPPLPPRATPQPAPQKVAPPPPPKVLLFAQELAPVIIPDKIKPVEVPPPPEPVTPTPQPAVAAGPPAGVPNGSAAGSTAGDLAGKLHGTPGGIIFPDGRLHIDRDEKLPMDPVDQEYPHYPHDAMKKGLEDQVIVRYVIGTDGRVKEVEIIDHAKEPMFDEAAVEAIRHWRFRPMVKDGKRVEVVHELAVNFQLVGH